MRRLVTRMIVRRLLPDIAAYFFDPGVRDAIQSRLLTALLAHSGPLIVVAHSMGTMIAYDVLHALGDAVDVRLWVTLGSPLGIAAVQDHLARPLAVPGGVRAWRNFADRLDPVALDRTLSSEFAPAGFIRDAWIVNPSGLDPEGFNPHSGTGYLSHPAVRSAVRAAIASSGR
ncbi:MAG: alpha/beta fold hydrolase [Planctomycetaceae bacterium]|nr:alpha/beta fold hydrolase [Planctomycetaceae bacterium]